MTIENDVKKEQKAIRLMRKSTTEEPLKVLNTTQIMRTAIIIISIHGTTHMITNQEDQQEQVESLLESELAQLSGSMP